MFLLGALYLLGNKLRHLFRNHRPPLPPRITERDTDTSEPDGNMSEQGGEIVPAEGEGCRETMPEASEAASHQSAGPARSVAAETDQVSAWGYTIRTLESDETDPNAPPQGDLDDTGFAERVYGHEGNPSRFFVDPALSISTSELISEMQEGSLLSHLLRIYEICHPPDGKLVDSEKCENEMSLQCSGGTTYRVSSDWESVDTFSAEQLRSVSQSRTEIRESSVGRDSLRNDAPRPECQFGTENPADIANWVGDLPDQSQSDSLGGSIRSPTCQRRKRKMSNLRRAARESL